ncbi:hypothetical protein [Acidilobus sp.]|uniref:hypothetical protein n=1 Tax=Acidilobus sp. TaxID=1872109 RepID=UPI003D085B6D
MRLNLDGRVYENPHMIVVGLKKLTGEISFGIVKIDGEFDTLPQASSSEDVVEVSSGGTFESDVSGSGVISLNELEDGYIIEFSKVTIKFDVDEATGKVSIKVPRIGTLKASKLLLDVSGSVSINLIVSPFVVGAITLSNDGRIKITAGDEVKITSELEDSSVGGSKQLQVQRASGRA